MARPEGFTDEECEAAERKLSELCKEYGIKPFEIKYTGSDSKKWQALVQRICGLQVDDPNRGARENEETFDIGNHAYGLLDFWEIDEETGKAVTKEDIYRRVVEAQQIKPKAMSGGRKTKPENRVKKALVKVMAKRQQSPED